MGSQAIQAVLDEAVAAGVAPGISAAVARADGTDAVFAAGVRGLNDPTPMDADTVVWIASCTKAITSAGALQLVEGGLVDLDEPLGPRVPALAEPKVLEGLDGDGRPKLRAARRPITLRHLLTHTSGMAYDFCSAEMAAYFAATGQSIVTAGATLAFDPGDGWQYGTGTDAVGWTVEAVTGQSLDTYLGAAILGPLGMADSTFAPGPERRAGMHARRPDGAFVALEPFPPTPGLMGGGGLNATVRDYLKFLRAVIGDGGGVLGPKALAWLRENATGNLPAGDLISANPAFSSDFRPMPGVDKRWTLGFLRNEADVPGARRTGSLAWGGIANCYYWADPASGVAGAMFAQFLPFADPGMLGAFDRFERAVYAG